VAEGTGRRNRALLPSRAECGKLVERTGNSAGRGWVCVRRADARLREAKVKLPSFLSPGGPSTTVLAALAPNPKQRPPAQGPNNRPRNQNPRRRNPAATVRLPAFNLGAQSDSTGRYAIFTIPKGNQVVVVRALGFRPETTTVAVKDSIDTVADFILQRTVAELPAVKATADDRSSVLDHQGFYERRQMGAGTFLDRADVAKFENGSLDRALVKVPGIQLIRGHGNHAWAVTSRNQPAGINPRCSLCRPVPLDSLLTRTDIELGAGRGCYMDVYLDGAPVYWMSEPPMPLFDLNDLHPAHVEAIEFYKSASQMPTRFNRTSAGCGAILIWTRTGGERE
jgi:hypothetical protein